MQAYSDPSRASLPHALPDVEVFYISEQEAADRETERERGLQDYVPYVIAEAPGFYYWYCFPGCLPDSDPIGPFATEADAIADAWVQS